MSAGEVDVRASSTAHGTAIARIGQERASFEGWRTTTREAVLTEVARFVAGRCARALGGSGVDIAEEVLLRFVDGGKCLRSTFMYLGWLCGAHEDESALRAAAGFELLHAFALMQDDVMDGSPIRRGRPSAHVAFAQWHRDRDLRHRVMTLLSGYGEAVGEAFRLRDDLLGVFGSTSVTGKPSGGDVSDQKATSVVVAAHYLAGPSLRRHLAQLMSSRDLDEVDVGRWRSLITATGAPQWIEHMIDERLTRALNWIDSHSLDPLVRVALTSMAAACTQRAA